MLPKHILITLHSSNKRRFAVLGSVLFLAILFFEGHAQSRQRSPERRPLPRVGTIKDYPATGLMTGCGNLYFYPASRANQADAYIFIARGDGDGAWMNLAGRDVRLRKLKSPTGRNRHRYYYRFGNVSITVLIQPFQPDDSAVAEGDPMLKMTITLRNGRARRIVRAVGDSDC